MKVTTIFGPPGTGKTTRLMEIAHERCMTQRGLLLSYTKAAALEVAGRINAGQITASTLHSLAFKRLNLGRASVVDTIKLKEFSLASGIPFKGMDGAEGEQEGDEYVSVLSYAKNRMLGDGEAYDMYGRPGTPARFKMFVEAYEKWKQTYGYMDFDDMLISASKMKFAPVPIVFLDEAQDCSPLQWSVFQQVVAGAKEVYIAGDDDQAIYEWSGADPHGMTRFAEVAGVGRSSYHVETVVLDKSYRLPKLVWDQADTLIREVKKRVAKLWDPAPRRGVVTRWGDFNLSAPLDPDWNVLILCRDNFRLRELQRELHEERVPYAMATSNSPYENKYAKALRGWMRKDDPPLDEEREALISTGTMIGAKLATERNWPVLRSQNPFKIINFPVRMRDFYMALDEKLLFAPLRYRLSTIHQAKGGEADLVIMDLAMTPRVESGIDLNRDAEVRVWYVGMTRARQELHICGENPIL